MNSNGIYGPSTFRKQQDLKFEHKKGHTFALGWKTVYVCMYIHACIYMYTWIRMIINVIMYNICIYIHLSFIKIHLSTSLMRENQYILCKYFQHLPTGMASWQVLQFACFRECMGESFTIFCMCVAPWTAAGPTSSMHLQHLPSIA